MEVFSYIGIICIFLAGMIPLIALGIDYARENKRLDQERKSKESLPS